MREIVKADGTRAILTNDEPKLRAGKRRPRVITTGDLGPDRKLKKGGRDEKA